jgi:drug/metabolite transporter (DMT)-like permease
LKKQWPVVSGQLIPEIAQIVYVIASSNREIHSEADLLATGHLSPTTYLPNLATGHWPPATNFKSHPARGYLFIAIATFFWGLAAVMGRAVFTHRVHFGGQYIAYIDPLTLAQSRATFSLLLLLPILWFKQPAALRIRPRDLAQFFLLGILGLAAANYFYYFAIQKTTVATAIVLQYVAPIWVLLYMLARGLQHATVRRVLGVALAVVGCGVAVGLVAARSGFPWLGLSGARFNAIGVLAAELAAVSFAFYNVYAQHLIQKYDRWTVLLYALLGASVFWQFVNPPWKIAAQHYTGGQWLFLLVFAITSMLVPFSFYFTGLQHLDPTRAVVTACLEPVWAIALTALMLGELVSPMQVVGILLVLAATILVQRPDKRAALDPIIAVEPIE